MQQLMAGPELRRLALERTRMMVRTADLEDAEQTVYFREYGGPENAALCETRVYDALKRLD